MVSTLRAISSILLPQQRRAACGFVALMLVGMVLEMFRVTARPPRASADSPLNAGRAAANRAHADVTRCGFIAKTRFYGRSAEKPQPKVCIVTFVD